MSSMPAPISRGGNDDALEAKTAEERCKFCGSPDVQWQYELHSTKAPSFVEIWAMCDVCHRHLRRWLHVFPA
jgi:hypothetical protein